MIKHEKKDPLQIGGGRVLCSGEGDGGADDFVEVVWPADGRCTDKVISADVRIVNDVVAGVLHDFADILSEKDWRVDTPAEKGGRKLHCPVFALVVVDEDTIRLEEVDCGIDERSAVRGRIVDEAAVH